MSKPLVGFVSFRLGGRDGVSSSARSWAECLRALNWDAVTIAGEGKCDRTVEGLSKRSHRNVSKSSLTDALSDVDMVIVENMFSLPLHLNASHTLAEIVRGRPTLVKHHDLPWQRDLYAHERSLPLDDSSWYHTAHTSRTAGELQARGFQCAVVPPAIVAGTARFPRDQVRSALGVAEHELLLLHPVRAIGRKNIQGALALAERLNAVYWLTGPAEEGYLATFMDQLSSVRTKTVWRPYDYFGIDAAYAAADAVLFPSSLEGFGLPPLECAKRDRPAIVGDYPASDELRQLGFRWMTLGNTDEALDESCAEFLSRDHLADVRHNRELVDAHFSHQHVRRLLGNILDVWFH